MKIEGSHTFAAPKLLIWPLLHDPGFLRLALPSSDQLDQVSPSEFTARLHIQEGPFQGEYKGLVQLTDDIPFEVITLGLSGEGPEGLIWGDGQIVLHEDAKHTTLQYTGELVVSGRTVTRSPRLLKTTANALIRQFMEALEHYIEIQTGTYTTKMADTSPRSRRSGAVELQDKLEEIRQNRRTLFIVVILIALAALMTIGAVAIAFILGRWVLKMIRQYVNRIVHEERQNQTLNEQQQI